MYSLEKQPEPATMDQPKWPFNSLPSILASIHPSVLLSIMQQQAPPSHSPPPPPPSVEAKPPWQNNNSAVEEAKLQSTPTKPPCPPSNSQTSILPATDSTVPVTALPLVQNKPTTPGSQDQANPNIGNLSFNAMLKQLADSVPLLNLPPGLMEEVSRDSAQKPNVLPTPPLGIPNPLANGPVAALSMLPGRLGSALPNGWIIPPPPQTSILSSSNNSLPGLPTTSSPSSNNSQSSSQQTSQVTDYKISTILEEHNSVLHNHAKQVPTIDFCLPRNIESFNSLHSEVFRSEFGLLPPGFKNPLAERSTEHLKTKTLIVDGVNLDEIKDFARHFKMKRISLGLTQTQVGQALTASEGPAYSQSAICRFEKLDITPKSAQRIKPVLEKWLIAAEEKSKLGNGANGDLANSDASRKRKRRTSFNPHALELLNEHFEKNPHPTGSEMSIIANSLNYDREVIRVWFCNKRQALKNTIKRIRTHEDQFSEFEEEEGDSSDQVSYCSTTENSNLQIV